MKSIIYVHKGNPFYLKLSLKQARASNPEADIILLGDNSNKEIAGIKHYDISDYFCRAKAFDNIFVNHSPNKREYELFCFQRWLVIWEFQQKHKEYDDSFVYCDSDTLLFANVMADLDQLYPNLLALEGGVGPAFTFFLKGTLGQFCNTIEWFFNHENGKEYLRNFVQKKKQENAIHGFSDMYAFEYFVNSVICGKVIDAQKDSYGWNSNNKSSQLFRYDQNVNFKEQFDLNDKGYKKFKIINELPYAYNNTLKEIVLFKGIHFQGKAKYEMIKFCHQSTTFLSKYWFQYQIIYRLKKIKRYIMR